MGKRVILIPVPNQMKLHSKTGHVKLVKTPDRTQQRGCVFILMQLWSTLLQVEVAAQAVVARPAAQAAAKQVLQALLPPALQAIHKALPAPPRPPTPRVASAMPQAEAPAAAPPALLLLRRVNTSA